MSSDPYMKPTGDVPRCDVCRVPIMLPADLERAGADVHLCHGCGVERHEAPNELAAIDVSDAGRLTGTPARPDAPLSGGALGSETKLRSVEKFMRSWGVTDPDHIAKETAIVNQILRDSGLGWVADREEGKDTPPPWADEIDDALKRERETTWQREREATAPIDMRLPQQPKGDSSCGVLVCFLVVISLMSYFL